VKFVINNLDLEQFGSAEEVGEAVKGAGLTTVLVTLLIQIIL